jgi:hypothetical protein
VAQDAAVDDAISPASTIAFTAQDMGKFVNDLFHTDRKVIIAALLALDELDMVERTELATLFSSRVVGQEQATRRKGKADLHTVCIDCVSGLVGR